MTFNFHTLLVLPLFHTFAKNLLQRKKEMTSYERFTRQEIPYGILEKFGLTQEMMEDLPNNVTERFLSGRATPVLPVITENAEGETVQSHARISLVRLPDGTVDVCFAPKWVDEDLKDFTQEQQEKLRLGEVTTAMMPGKGRCFVQFDDTISQVMAVPVEIINQNISLLTRSFTISDDAKARLQDGGIVELEINNQILSAGIDLNELTGIRVANGDIMAWQEDAKADRLPKYNFGIYGCWLADDENVLSYVKEKDYTEEMDRELTRAGNQNAAREQMKQMKRS